MADELPFSISDTTIISKVPIDKPKNILTFPFNKPLHRCHDHQMRESSHYMLLQTLLNWAGKENTKITIT